MFKFLLFSKPIAVVVSLLALGILVGAYFVMHPPAAPASIVITTVPVEQQIAAVPEVATTTQIAAPPPTVAKPVIVKPEVPTPVVTPIIVPPQPVYIPPVVVVPVVTTTTTVSTTTTTTTVATTTVQSEVVGSTTLAVASIPLLSGGTAHAGETVPVSYLQITNLGTASALLQGFWLTQTGSASTSAIIVLSTVDDRGTSRNSTVGPNGASPFNGNSALAVTSAYFAPGQTRLFTIKATLSGNALPYLGTNIVLQVASLQSTATVHGQFPIAGTTWAIAQ